MDTTKDDWKPFESLNAFLRYCEKNLGTNVVEPKPRQREQTPRATSSSGTSARVPSLRLVYSAKSNAKSVTSTT